MARQKRRRKMTLFSLRIIFCPPIYHIVDYTELNYITVPLRLLTHTHTHTNEAKRALARASHFFVALEDSALDAHSARCLDVRKAVAPFMCVCLSPWCSLHRVRFAM